jgi:imidazolonepropionase-like amidohydrolase
MDKIIHCKGLWDFTTETLKKDIYLKLNNSKFGIIPKKSINKYVNVEHADYLIPPFFDAHVHLFLSGSDNLNIRKRELNDDFETTLSRVGDSIKKCVKYGIGAVRDAGDNGFFTIEHEKISKDKSFIIIPSGKALYKKGRYGAFIGLPVENRKELEFSLELLLQKGVKTIKVLNSGVNSIKEFAKETEPQFTKDELKIIVNFAKKHNLKTMIHVNGKKALDLTLDFNVDSVEHAFFMSKENAEIMAKNNIKITPTFSAMYNLTEMEGLSLKEKSIIKKTVEFHINEIKYFLDKGGKICLGTDSGSFNVKHGESFLQEIKFFKENLNLSFNEILSIICRRNYLLAGILPSPAFINLKEFNLNAILEQNFNMFYF